MSSTTIWMLVPLLVPLLVGLYCLIQAVRDFRRRNYVLAAVGAACLILLWTMPIQTRAVKYDLGIAQPR
jgi:hypothetical protein